jgi:hypothetical protein
MPTFRVTYRYPTCFRRLLEDIEADALDTEQDGSWWVLWRSQLVIGQPRRVVRLRVSAREATIEPLPCPGAGRAGTVPTAPTGQGRRPA